MRLAIAVLGLVAIAAQPVMAAEAATPAQNEFFETRIRPVLVEQCYKCHNSAKLAEGSLAIDFRAGVLKGGDGGAIIVPGQPGMSRLIPILRHEVSGLRMPKNGGKLNEHVVADFEKWIAMGAPDPRDKPPSTEELARATSWDTILHRLRRSWLATPGRRIRWMASFSPGFRRKGLSRAKLRMRGHSFAGCISH
jgi:hypothetical protein